MVEQYTRECRNYPTNLSRIPATKKATNTDQLSNQMRKEPNNQLSGQNPQKPVMSAVKGKVTNTSQMSKNQLRNESNSQLSNLLSGQNQQTPVKSAVKGKTTNTDQLSKQAAKIFTIFLTVKWKATNTTKLPGQSAFKPEPMASCHPSYQGHWIPSDQAICIDDWMVSNQASCQTKLSRQPRKKRSDFRLGLPNTIRLEGGQRGCLQEGYQDCQSSCCRKKSSREGRESVQTGRVKESCQNCQSSCCCKESC